MVDTTYKCKQNLKINYMLMVKLTNYTPETLL